LDGIASLLPMVMGYCLGRCFTFVISEGDREHQYGTCGFASAEIIVFTGEQAGSVRVYPYANQEEALRWTDEWWCSRIMYGVIQGELSEIHCGGPQMLQNMVRQAAAVLPSRSSFAPS
jgi:hypothetical protein